MESWAGDTVLMLVEEGTLGGASAPPKGKPYGEALIVVEIKDPAPPSDTDAKRVAV